MLPRHPWIEAVIESFPADDPKNEQRRERLFEASTANPAVHGTDRSIEPPPESLRRPSHRRRCGVDAILLLIIASIIWFQWLSPEALYRLRGIALTDISVNSIASVSLSGPLANLVGSRPGESNDDIILSQTLQRDLRRRIPTSKHAICLGAPGAYGAPDQWQPFWGQNPNTPMVFADRARTLAHDDVPLDSGFLDTAEHYDPGNGYYRFLALLQSADSLIESTRRRTPRYLIPDPQRFSNFWDQFDRALSMDRWDSHSRPLMEQRLANWPTTQDFPDLTRDLFWANCYLTTSTPGSHSLQRLFSAQAESLAASGDVSGMRQHCQRWRGVLKHLIELHDLPPLSLAYHFGSNRNAMGTACKTLGLEEETNFFSGPPFDHQQVLPALYFQHDSEEGKRGGVSFSENRAPGRLAEHRMYEGLYLQTAAMLLLLFVAPTALFQLLLARQLRGLPKHLSHLLRPLDHLKIIGLGILFPLAVVLFALNLPHLQPRDETIHEVQAAGTLLKLASLIVAILMLTVRQIFLALARRGHPLGFSPIACRPLLFLGLLAMTAAFAGSALVQNPDIPGTDEEQWVWLGLFSMLGLEILLLVASALILLRATPLRLQLSTAGHVLTRHMILAATIIALLVPIYRAFECHWVAQADSDRFDLMPARQMLLGESPAQLTARQMLLDYLDTAPTY